jgi:very-short-patch-repair endonuclease
MNTTENDFFLLAKAAGLALERSVAMPWLSNRGHLNSVIGGDAVVQRLRAMHAMLHGDARLLASKRASASTRLDFVFCKLNLIIEVDELQHFTSERLATLERYPADAELAFDVERYRAEVERWRHKADRYRASKPAADFPFAGGRRAQRAYFDACRDLTAPVHGLRVLRIPAPERDGALAFRRFMEALEHGISASLDARLSKSATSSKTSEPGTHSRGQPAVSGPRL